MNNYDRRRFLKLVSAAGLAYFALPKLNLIGGGLARAGVGKRVLVIGAGMGGLSTSHKLTARGIPVTILEARNRIGGRIQTDRSHGAAVDLGASWIHGQTRNPLTALAKKYRIPTFASDLDDWKVYDADGKLIPDREVARMERWLDRMKERAEELAEDLDEDVSYIDWFKAAIKGRTLSARETRMLESHFTGVEVESGARADRLSGWYGEDDEAFPGKDLLFPQGYDAMLNELAKGLDIKLDTTVESVSWSDDGVRIETDKGRFDAAAVVVTLPLGVLKRGAVRFEPGLGREKDAAIDRLGMGVLNKIVLTFPSVFWPRGTEYMEYVSGVKRNGAVAAKCMSCHGAPELRDAGEFSEFCNMVPVNGAKMLVGFTGGAFGFRLESFGDAEIRERIMNVLRIIYGREIPDPVAMTVTRWHLEQHSLGAYPHVPVGATMHDFDVIARPIGNRIFFAGDGTISKYPSTVHGAYLSGQRAATEVARALTI